MKLEQIRRAFDISQKELSVFLGISRSVIGMSLSNHRNLTLSDSNSVDTMYDAVFKEPGKSAIEALNEYHNEHTTSFQAQIPRQLASLATSIHSKMRELEFAQRNYQKLQFRFLAIINLYESYEQTNGDMTPIHLKWLEKHMLLIKYQLKTEGLSRIHQIELELHQLKSKQAFLESRLLKQT